MPPLGRRPSEHYYNVWYGKSENSHVWLPDGEKSFRICLAVLTQYRRVTGGQTDRHLATA